MKKQFIGALVLLGGFGSFHAFADHEGGGEHHPCQKIKQACEAAGFKKGDHKDKKGLFLDCLDPILKGQTVAGVSAAPADVQACKAKHDAHHEHHDKK